MNRNLDGVYFRVKRDGKYESLCFSDLTHEERETIMESRTKEWLENLCQILADTLKDVGDQLDIRGASAEE